MRCAAPTSRGDLITHPEVEKAYERYLDGAFLRQGQGRGSFEYAGILFEDYRGRVGSGEPERREPDGLVWTLDVRPA